MAKGNSRFRLILDKRVLVLALLLIGLTAVVLPGMKTPSIAGAGLLRSKKAQSIVKWCSGANHTSPGRCSPADKIVSVTEDLKTFQVALRRAMDARRLMTDEEHTKIVSSLDGKLIRDKPFRAGSSAAYNPYALYVHAQTNGMVNINNHLWLEFGVFTGASTNITAHSQRDTKIRVHGFDTFTGLPEEWKGHLAKGAFDQGGNFPPAEPGVEFHKGLFSETLPGVLEKNKKEKIAGMNIDCDLYRGAIEAMNMSYSFWTPGTMLHFHELQQSPKSVNLESTIQEESVALHEFLLTHPGTVLEMLPIQNSYSENVILFVIETPKK
jgi:hypothetical protein